ncbi:MAG TPA: DnaJ domain-containing protein [Thermomonas sp.]|nr:DnaJ domain-containing protein [Thermomonas sp.]
MTGATGDALEWALALLQAPGQGRALRGQPLPPGMERLLAIASGGAPDLLQQSARAFGESPQRLQEAARFYVRQVLFHVDADAYRVLGVRADAGPAELKNHYRLLQQWLHPDRLESRDDAVFATRVNQAWQQLRTPGRRDAYDRRRPRLEAVQTADAEPHRAPPGPWVPLESVHAPAGHWRRQAPVLALVAACLVMLLLALRDGGPAWEPQPGDSGARIAIADWTGLAVHAPPAADNGARLPRDRLSPRSKPMDPAASGRRAGPRLVRQPRQAASPVDARPPMPPASPTPRAFEAVPAPPPSEMAPNQREVAAADGAAPVPGAAAALGPKALPVDGLPGFTQVDAARAVGRQLLDFLQGHGRVAPPIWNTPAQHRQAEALRERLLAGGTVRFEAPQWQIGAARADLHVMLVDTPQARRLVAAMVWREGRWWVTELRLETAS